MATQHGFVLVVICASLLACVNGQGQGQGQNNGQSGPTSAPNDSPRPLAAILAGIQNQFAPAVATAASTASGLVNQLSSLATLATRPWYAGLGAGYAPGLGIYAPGFGYSPYALSPAYSPYIQFVPFPLVAAGRI